MSKNMMIDLAKTLGITTSEFNYNHNLINPNLINKDKIRMIIKHYHQPTHGEKIVHNFTCTKNIVELYNLLFPKSIITADEILEHVRSISTELEFRHIGILNNNITGIKPGKMYYDIVPAEDVDRVKERKNNQLMMDEIIKKYFKTDKDKNLDPIIFVELWNMVYPDNKMSFQYLKTYLKKYDVRFTNFGDVKGFNINKEYEKLMTKANKTIMDIDNSDNDDV